MKNLIIQLEEANKLVETGARAIARVQGEITRLQHLGKNFSKAQELLANYHALQLKILAEQIRLQKALKEIKEE